MYIAITSFIVKHTVHQAWLQSIRESYIPALREKGYDQLTFARWIANEPSEEFTYSLQVTVTDLEAFRTIRENILAPYGKTLKQQFGENVLWYVSLLKHVEY